MSKKIPNPALKFAPSGRWDTPSAHQMRKHPPSDANGNRVKIGDMVRVIGVPDLSGMDPECEKETRLAFEHLVGKYKRVQEFDKYGCAHLSFRILNGESEGWHSVWIEPFLLKVKKNGKGL